LTAFPQPDNTLQTNKFPAYRPCLDSLLRDGTPPKLSHMALSPREDEAAAIAAAIGRFVAETAPPAGGEGEAVGPWQRAALIEGVGGKCTVEDSEGGERWLS